ncbi:MAG: hypothetical protein H6708_16835 [Kofleriaceae bacterium]|nr:hypothetical protein [Myxococcales bacterium]MCB9562071.1 hypothetical protein [Kofleriaceae bacterium]
MTRRDPELRPIPLIGSRTEAELRAALVRSRDALRSDPEQGRLLDAVRTVCPTLRTACVLAVTPDQGEDLYLVLVDDTALISVELDRTDPEVEPIVEPLSLVDYARDLSRSGRIQLAVALDLARQDLERAP